MLLILILACVFSIVLSRILANKLVSRIETINKTASSIIESNNLDIRVDIKNKTDEIAKLADTFNKMIQSLKDSQTRFVESEKRAALLDLAAQVAHDIRSPLSALEMMVQDIHQIPEEKRIITRNAIDRIRDIANNLLYERQHTKNNQIAISACLLTSVIDSLVSEKRMQFRTKLNMHIEFTPSVKSYGLFSYINLHEFKRVLSNLINNAVEAMDYKGDVIISLEHDKNNAYDATLGVNSI